MAAKKARLRLGASEFRVPTEDSAPDQQTVVNSGSDDLDATTRSAAAELVAQREYLALLAASEQSEWRGMITRVKPEQKFMRYGRLKADIPAPAPIGNLVIEAQRHNEREFESHEQGLVYGIAEAAAIWIRDELTLIAQLGSKGKLAHIATTPEAAQLRVNRIETKLAKLLDLEKQIQGQLRKKLEELFTILQSREGIEDHLGYFGRLVFTKMHSEARVAASPSKSPEIVHPTVAITDDAWRAQAHERAANADLRKKVQSRSLMNDGRTGKF